MALLRSLRFIISGSHPVFIRILLALTTVAISLFAISLAGSWFFYLLVLVFLGGVIVLIIYMSTLCTNEKFIISPRNLIMLFALLTVILGIIRSNERGISSVRIFGAGFLYEGGQVFSLAFLISYLLIALVCVVKLVKFEHGPLVKRL